MHHTAAKVLVQKVSPGPTDLDATKHVHGPVCHVLYMVPLA